MTIVKSSIQPVQLAENYAQLDDYLKEHADASERFMISTSYPQQVEEYYRKKRAEQDLENKLHHRVVVKDDKGTNLSTFSYAATGILSKGHQEPPLLLRISTAHHIRKRRKHCDEAARYLTNKFSVPLLLLLTSFKPDKEAYRLFERRTLFTQTGKSSPQPSQEIYVPFQ